LLKFLMASLRLKVFDVTENHGDKCSWFFAPSGFSNINFSDTSHSVFVKISIDSVLGFLSTIKLNQFIQKVIIFYML